MPTAPPYPLRHFPGVAIEEETRERLGVERHEEGRSVARASWANPRTIALILAGVVLLVVVALGLSGLL